MILKNIASKGLTKLPISQVDPKLDPNYLYHSKITMSNKMTLYIGLANVVLMLDKNRPCY